MLVSTSVYSVTTHNGVLQYHRVHSLPTYSAISSSAERQSTNNSTLNSLTQRQTDRLQELCDASAVSLGDTLSLRPPTYLHEYLSATQSSTSWLSTSCSRSSMHFTWQDVWLVHSKHSSPKPQLSNAHKHTIYSHNVQCKSLVLLQVNCRSICNKIMELWILIETCNAKVVICTECWVNEGMNDVQVFRADYISFDYKMCSIR
jgi:hypothetical protein